MNHQHDLLNLASTGDERCLHSATWSNVLFTLLYKHMLIECEISVKISTHAIFSFRCQYTLLPLLSNTLVSFCLLAFYTSLKSEKAAFGNFPLLPSRTFFLFMQCSDLTMATMNGSNLITQVKLRTRLLYSYF